MSIIMEKIRLSNYTDEFGAVQILLLPSGFKVTKQLKSSDFAFIADLIIKYRPLYEAYLDETVK